MKKIETPIIQFCNDCKQKSVFEINEYQDGFYVDGFISVRLRECVKCGRYEDIQAKRDLITCANELFDACDEALTGLYLEHAESCTEEDCSYLKTYNKLSTVTAKAEGCLEEN